jgi:hypothetical protein
MNEVDVFRLLLARRDNYDISEMKPIGGRAYSLVMGGRRYNAVILPNSFDYYELRYHIAKHLPDLVICFQHNSVLPIPVLSLKASNLAKPCELPTGIMNLEKQRHHSKIGSQCLLGAYLCGLKSAQDIIHHKDFSPRTRRRYLQKARELGRRKPGRPVDTKPKQTKAS